MTLYFAYGSNLSSRRIHAPRRAPRALLVGRGVLEGYALRTHKRGRDGSGKCDVTVDGGACVHGVVWELRDGDLRSLDRVEGLGQGYLRSRVAVACDGGTLEAETYVAMADAIDPAVLPFDWYMGLVIGGAAEHGLPEPYIRSLEALPVKIDPDRRRARRAAAILGL